MKARSICCIGYPLWDIYDHNLPRLIQFKTHYKVTVMHTNFRYSCLALALALAGTVATASAGIITLTQAGSSGVTATIMPDPAEIGQPAQIWLGAVRDGSVFLRGNGMRAWSQYSSGALPVAQESAALPSSLQITVIDLDLSAYPGLAIYVGYGSSEADLGKSNHLTKIYSVPATATPSPTPTPTTPAPSGTSVYAGSYGGSYSGDDAGTVSYTVDSSGKITVTVPGPGAGTLASSGSASFATGGGGVSTISCSFSGTFYTSGSASGSWRCTDSEDGSISTGSWSASKR